MLNPFWKRQLKHLYEGSCQCGTKHLKYRASQRRLARRILWHDVYSLRNSRSKSQSLHLSMTELYHPLVFYASLEFKCMQRSKPPFRRKRWCNKQKPPDSAHSSPSATGAPFLHTEVFLQFATRGQECLGVLFFPPLLPFTLIPSLQLSACYEWL